MSGPRIKDYRDLLAWQRAIDLAVVCDTVCSARPGSSSHVVSQVRRAANSVHANIAEGNGRFSRPDYLRHLAIANGSLRELESNLLYISRLGRTPPRLDEALALCALVAKLLGGLIRALRGRKETAKNREAFAGEAGAPNAAAGEAHAGEAPAGELPAS